MPIPRFFRSALFALCLGSVFWTSSAEAVSVKVRVVDADKKPIAGASVRYTELGKLPDEPDEGTGQVKPQTVAVGDDGSLALDLAELSEVKAKARIGSLGADEKAKGPILASARVRAPGYAFDDAELRAGDNEIVLGPQAQLRGLIRDKNGEPLPGARVRLNNVSKTAEDESFYFGSEDDSPATVSGADGSWTLGELPQTGIASVVVSAPQRMNAQFRAWLEGAENEAPTQKLSVGGTVKGRFVDENGAGIKGVSAFFYGGASYGGKPSDEQGNFALEGLPVGAGALNFYGRDEAWFAPTKPISYQIPERGGEVDVGKIKSGKGVLVSGIVVDKTSKKPLPDLELNINNRKTVTDADGRFEKRTSGGYLQFSIVADYISSGRSFTEILDKAETYDMGRIAVEPAANLTVEVRDEADKEVKETAVMVSNDRNTEYVQFDGTKMGAGPLAPGEYEIKGYGSWEVVEPQKTTVVADKAAAKTLIVKVRKKAEVNLVGRVLDATGAPLGNVGLQIGAATGQNRWQTVNALSRRDGTWKAEVSQFKVEPEIRKIERDLYSKMSGGEISRDGEGWRAADTVMARSDGRLSGRVVDADGSPVAGAALRWLGSKPGEFAQTDADGQWELADLPDAALPLQISDGPRLIETAPIEPGEIRDIVLPADNAPANLDVLWAEQSAAGIVGLERYYQVVGGPRLLKAAQAADAKKAEAKKPGAGEIGAHLDAYLGMLAEREAPSVLSEGLALVKTFDAESLSGEGASQFALLAARSDDVGAKAWAQTWFDARKAKVSVREGNSQAIENALRLAAVGGALGLDEAFSYRDLALVFIERSKGESRQYQLEKWGGLLWEGGPQSFEQALGEWSPADRMSAISGALKRVENVEQGRELLARLDKLKDDPAVIQAEADLKETQPYRESVRDRAVESGRVSLARALAPTDPAAALQLAEKTSRGYQVQGVALEIARAAIAQNKAEVARGALRLGLKDNYVGRSGTAALAMLARSFDAAIADELLASMATSVFPDERFGGGDYQTVAYYAMALRDSEPGRGRLLLEQEWARRQSAKVDKENSWNRNSQLRALARAMAFYDVARALEWAEKAGQENVRESLPLAITALAMAAPTQRAFVVNDSDRF